MADGQRGAKAQPLDSPFAWVIAVAPPGPLLLRMPKPGRAAIKAWV